MNILQLTQLIGRLKISDIEGGFDILAILSEKLPDGYKLTIDTTGYEIGEYYNNLSATDKKKITDTHIQEDSSLLTDALNDIIYHKHQLLANQEQQTNARFKQISVVMVCLLLYSTYVAYSYYRAASSMLKDQYRSHVMDVANDVVSRLTSK